MVRSLGRLLNAVEAEQAESRARGSRWVTATGVGVALVGLIFQLTPGGGQPGRWWQWMLIAGGAAMLIIGLTRSNLRQRSKSETKVDFRKLIRRWPDFEAKVKTFAEFFDYSLIYNIASPLRAADWLDLSAPQDAALNARREAALSAVGFLNRLSFELAGDLNPRPRRTDEAKRLASRFSALMAAPRVLAIEELLQTLARRSPHPEDITQCLERLVAFKRDYESFSRAANQHLGAEFFRQYVP